MCIAAFAWTPVKSSLKLTFVNAESNAIRTYVNLKLIFNHLFHLEVGTSTMSYCRIVTTEWRYLQFTIRKLCKKRLRSLILTIEQKTQ